MFAIYDQKAEFYLSPITFNSRGESLRNFSDAVNDSTTMLHRHPADFTLFEIGTYDNEKCEIQMHTSPINLGNAIEFVEQPELFPEDSPTPHHPTNGV